MCFKSRIREEDLIFGPGPSDDLDISHPPGGGEEKKRMKLNYTFKHLDRSEALEKHIGERLEEVGRFLLKDGYGNIYISKQNHEFCVEVSVNTREKYFKAAGMHSDPYTCADAVIDKLEKQFLKLRKVVQTHKNPEKSKTGRLEQMNDRFEVQQRFKKAA